ncbi:MAG: KilA-N domain-containing protein [Bacteroidia bacterium]
MAKIEVLGKPITVLNENGGDYICITDMVKAKDDNSRAADVIKNWIRNRGTIEFLGAWETIYNPNFKVVEFDHFKKEAGLPTFTLSVSSWVEKTNAIGMFSKSGKYGGTYAHKDIAFEFGSAISPVFKLYIIKEFQRLKEIESNTYNLEWNVKRIVSKANYTLHTDAIKDHLLPKMNIQKQKEWLVYASEADILNVALWGCTAKQWKEANPQLALNNGNIRDSSSINELAVLSNIESLNSILIKQGMSKEQRFNFLSQTAYEQLTALNKVDFLKSLKYTSESVYVDAIKNTTPIIAISKKSETKLSKFNQNIKKALGYNPKDKDHK